jgi:hypothetical protein
MDKENRWIGGVVLRSTAEIADCLPREESTIMPHENQQRPTGRELVAQRRGPQTLPNDRLVECRRNVAHHILA